jgi:hypothetical protein
VEIKIVGGVHKSKEGYSGPDEFEFVTYEVDGITYNRKWDNDTIMEPWLVDLMLKTTGYPEDMPADLIKNYCLNVIRYSDIQPITHCELSFQVACSFEGWDAHKKFIAKE